MAVEDLELAPKMLVQVHKILLQLGKYSVDYGYNQLGIISFLSRRE